MHIPALLNPEVPDKALPPFLRLPAELRNQIYYYVLGGKHIHIACRSCYPGEKGFPYDSKFIQRNWMTQDEEWYNAQITPFKGAAAGLAKITHMVCSRPTANENAYQLSSQRERNLCSLCTVKKSDATAKYFLEGDCHTKDGLCGTVHEHIALHAPCRGIISQFQKQKYGEFCDECRNQYRECPPFINDWRHLSGLSRACSHRNRDLLQFGPPKTGLPKRHADTAFNLSLLKVCKQIAIDTALLPYSLNTFEFESGTDAIFFASNYLHLAQRGAISSMWISRCPWPKHLKDVADLYCGLKEIGLFLTVGIYDDPHVFADKFDINGMSGRHKAYGIFKKAKVIYGADKHVQNQGWMRNSGREARRKTAERVEDRLIGKTVNGNVNLTEQFMVMGLWKRVLDMYSKRDHEMQKRVEDDEWL